MKFKLKRSVLNGEISIPGSKSHTIRSLFIATLASGKSEIIDPLRSSDTLSAVEACRALGAEVETGDTWVVRGTGGEIKPRSALIDIGNSGTSARFVTGAAALGREEITITGDEQSQSRPMGPLIDALNNLGAEARSLEKAGCLPIRVKGRIRGGETGLSGVTSQFLSALLITCPLAERDSLIIVHDLNERPYVEMTLRWLDSQGILHEQEGFSRFHIKGNQAYRNFSQRVPADFSSATFFFCAGAVTDSDILLKGLDMEDSQGDKKVIEYLREMGADITVSKQGIRIRGGKELHGMEIDMNDTPDALPAMAVAGCLATGETLLRNVPQARLKETDRIAVMKEELTGMGGDITELPDGLRIKGGALNGAVVNGHNDHRVVMSLAVAGLAADGETVIKGAEAVKITFPEFFDMMKELGAGIEREE